MSLFLFFRERRPAEVFSGDDVGVEMEDGLAGFFSRIHHEAETVFCESFGFGDFLHDKEEIGEFLILFFIEIENIGDVEFRDDEDVHGGAGLDIAEREPIVIFVDFVARNFSGGDFAKQTIFHFHFLLTEKHNFNAHTDGKLLPQS